MQEIVLILSSLAGVATAAAVRKIPRNKNQLLSLGASSHIKSQITSLKIEKDILTKTISRLYHADSEFSKIQKDKLLLKYQHQLGIVLAKLEKLEHSSQHPDLGPVGDGLITLMDQKLSKLDDRLYELSSKITSVKPEPPKVTTEPKQKSSSVFNFDKPNKSKMEPVEIPATKSRQSFELTTLTNISRTEPKPPSIQTPSPTVVKPMPQPRVIPTQQQQQPPSPKDDDIVGKITQPNPIADDKNDILSSSFTPKVDSKTLPDLDTITKITKLKALPEPVKEKPAITLDDDFVDDDNDDDDLDKIKGKIMKVLSKLDQAEVE